MVSTFYILGIIFASTRANLVDAKTRMGNLEQKVALPTDEFGDYNGSDLISWIESHSQGIVHPSIRIGRERPGDESSLVGLFVASNADTKPIEKDEVIAQIPWDRIIHPGEKYHNDVYFSCDTIWNLVHEMKLGDKSTKAPYVRYLATQTFDTIPGQWSTPAQELFAYMLDNGKLPPSKIKWKDTYVNEWVHHCKGDPSIDPIERAAYFLTRSREEDTLMVPLYDMTNHSNDPKKLNTLSRKPGSPGDVFLLIASRKIMPGEQIYNSYNRCNSCSRSVDWDQCETFSWNRTPDLFAEFGFIEDYPQSWKFIHHHVSEIKFCLERDEDTDEIDVYRETRIDNDMPSKDEMDYLAGQLRKLEYLCKKKSDFEKKLVFDREHESMNENTGDSMKDEKMSRSEWDMIWNYHRSLVSALKKAIEFINEIIEADDEDGGGTAALSCAAEGDGNWN